MSTDINIKKRIAVLEESAIITADVNSIDFVGSGVNASTIGGDVTVTIPGGSGNTTYYLNQTVDQSPYKEFSSIVTSAIEQVVPLTVAGGVTSVIAEYQTPSGIPGTTQIPGGLWQFFLHFNAVAAGQNWIIRPTVYKRDLGGIETLIFTPDPEIVTGMSTTTTMYVSDGVFLATTLLTTDRIVVRISMQNTTGVSQTVNFRTEGSQHYSVGLTTLNQVIPTGAVTNVTGTAPVVSSGGTTPAISIPQADTLTDGYLSSTDWNTFNNKPNNLSQLNDVDIITTPLGDGEVLTYDGVSGLWKNEPPNSTPTNQVVLFADLGTTEALKACTYNNGTLGVGATLTGNVNGQLSTISFTDRIDNVVTALDQIILVRSQSNQTQNGIYVVTQLGSLTQPFIITRTTDADTQTELYPLQINIFGGSTLSNLAFLQKTVDPVVGTSNIVFTTTVVGIQNTPVLHIDTVTSAPLPTCTYTSGTNPTLPGSGAFLEATVNGTFPSINGVTLTAGRRFLVKDQVNQAHNGTYAVSNIGSASTKWRIFRVDAWGGNFTVLEREWKVNNPTSTKYGARYSTNLLGLANTNVGITSIPFFEAITSSSGIFGIANTSGVYTFYATLTLAMAVAVTGDTIVQFANVIETGNVTITLKNGVNINGNGYTYTYSNIAGHCFIDNASTVICNIINFYPIRSSASGSSSVWNITGASSEIYFYGGLTKDTVNTAHTTAIFNCKVMEGYNGLVTDVSAGVTGCAVSVGIFRNVKSIVSSGGGTGFYVTATCVSATNIYGYSISSFTYGVLISGGGTYTNITGESIAGLGLGSNVSSAKIYNSVGRSTTEKGIHSSNGGLWINCVGISSSYIGLNAYGGTFKNCNGYSATGNGVYLQDGNDVNDVSFNGGTATSDGAIAMIRSAGAGYKNTIKLVSITCKWNNAGGHAFQKISSGNVWLSNCSLAVTNASANCLHATSAVTMTWGLNTFEGSTTAVNANVTQLLVNTADAQGNLLL
jgi:hypothetical protein